MQKNLWIVPVALLMLTAATGHADTTVTAYANYWEGDDSGRGAGLRVRKTLLAFGMVEAHAGYAEFTDTDTELIPMEVAVGVRLPFFISPYAGVGTGYYVADSSTLNVDDGSGVFAMVGAEVTILWFGAVAEIRYHDLEEDYFDGTSYRAGLILRF